MYALSVLCSVTFFVCYVSICVSSISLLYCAVCDVLCVVFRLFLYGCIVFCAAYILSFLCFVVFRMVWTTPSGRYVEYYIIILLFPANVVTAQPFCVCLCELSAQFTGGLHGIFGPLVSSSILADSPDCACLCSLLCLISCLANSSFYHCMKCIQTVSCSVLIHYTARVYYLLLIVTSGNVVIICAVRLLPLGLLLKGLALLFLVTVRYHFYKKFRGEKL